MLAQVERPGILLLTTHYSLLTTHYSLLTTHYSLQVERPGITLVGAEEAAQLGYSLSLLGLTLLNVAIKV